MKQVTDLMSESLNLSHNWFVQNIDSFKKIKQVTDLSNTDSIKELNNWLTLWVSHWIIHSIGLFKNIDSFKNYTSDWPYEWVIESFTQSVCSKTKMNVTWKHETTQFCF